MMMAMVMVDGDGEEDGTAEDRKRDISDMQDYWPISYGDLATPWHMIIVWQQWKQNKQKSE